MKRVSITIQSCGSCPHYGETTIPCPNGRGYLMECRNWPLPILIQRPDEEHGPFPEWCPLDSANV